MSYSATNGCFGSQGVGGDKQTVVAQMKGQMTTIEQASIAKKCDIKFEGKAPPS